MFGLGLMGSPPASAGGAPPIPDLIQNGQFDGVSPWELNGGATITSNQLRSLDDSGIAPTRGPLRRLAIPGDALSLIVDFDVVPGGAVVRINLYNGDGPSRQMLFQGTPSVGTLAVPFGPDSAYTHIEFQWFEAGFRVSRVQLLTS